MNSTLTRMHPGTVRRVPAPPKFRMAGRPDLLPYSDDEQLGWVRLSTSDRAVPAGRFRLVIALAEPECIVELHVRVDPETQMPAVDAMQVARTGDMVNAGPPITGAVVRRLALDTLLRKAIDEVAEPIVPVKLDGHAGVFQLRRDVEAGDNVTAYGGRPIRPPRRNATKTAITPDVLREVADLYRQADHAPTQAVADQMHVSRSHAGRLVQQARAAGHLGPAARGKAGEVGTDA